MDFKRLPNGCIDWDYLEAKLTEDYIEYGSRHFGLGGFYGGRFKRTTVRNEPANQTWFESRRFSK